MMAGLNMPGPCTRVHGAASTTNLQHPCKLCCVALYRLQCGLLGPTETATDTRHRVPHELPFFWRRVSIEIGWPDSHECERWLLLLLRAWLIAYRNEYVWRESSSHAPTHQCTFTYIVLFYLEIYLATKYETGINYIIISLINVFGFVSIVSNVKSQFYSFRSFARFQINPISVCVSVIMDDTHTKQKRTVRLCADFPRALLFVYAQINQFFFHELEVWVWPNGDRCLISDIVRAAFAP